MPTSAARLAANRANARRSTGPRTLKGKAASSRNALKHGAYAADDTLLALATTATASTQPNAVPDATAHEPAGPRTPDRSRPGPCHPTAVGGPQATPNPNESLAELLATRAHQATSTVQIGKNEPTAPTPGAEAATNPPCPPSQPGSDAARPQCRNEPTATEPDTPTGRCAVPTTRPQPEGAVIVQSIQPPEPYWIGKGSFEEALIAANSASVSDVWQAAE